MMAAAKRTVANLFQVKPAPDAKPTTAELEANVAAARERLEAAKAEHSGTEAEFSKVQQELETIRASFDADGSGENVDRLIEAQRTVERQKLFTQRTQRAVATAEGELRAAESAHDAAALAALEERVSGAWDQISKILQEEAVPAFQTLNAALRKADAIIADAQAAQRQASRIRGHDLYLAGAKVSGVQSLHNVLTARLRELLPHKDRIRLVRAID